MRVRWTYEEFIRYLRGILVLKAFWSDRQALVRQALAGAEIVHYRFDPNSWPPSTLVAKAGDRYEVYCNGTSNSWQGFAHVKGVIGLRRKHGVVHFGMDWAAKEVTKEVAPYLPSPASSGQVSYYGHSYGGGVVQVLADDRVDAGADPASIFVTCYGAPKVFTRDVGLGTQRVELLMNRDDLVPYLIWWNLPLWLYGPDGYIPIKDLGDDHWDFRGKRNFISRLSLLDDDFNKSVSDDSVDTLREQLAWHFYDGYVRMIKNVAIHEEQFPFDQRYQDLIAIDKAIDEGDKPAHTFAGSTWVPGMPEDPFAFLKLSPSFASNGGTMTKAIEVQLFFSNKGGHGWSETHYFISKTNDDVTIDQAHAATKVYMEARAALFNPKVRYGVHLELLAARFAEEGGDRRAYVTTNFKFNPPTYPNDGSGATAVELPGTCLFYRCYAGNVASRMFFFRPIPSQEYIDKSGVKINPEASKEAVNGLLIAYVNQQCWAIKAQARSTNPKRLVTSIYTTPLSAGHVGFRVTGHGLSAGEEVKISGGKPFHKPVRGRYIVDTVPDADTFTVATANSVSAMSGGCTAQKVSYGYFLINDIKYMRQGHRQTGRPYDLGHG